MVPTGKASPGLWFDVREAKQVLSLAVGGVQVMTAVATPSSVGCVMSAGVPEITGSSSSGKNVDGQTCYSEL